MFLVLFTLFFGLSTYCRLSRSPICLQVPHTMAPSFSVAVLIAIATAGHLIAAQDPVAGAGPGHPSLLTWRCTNSGGCVSQDTCVVLDWAYHSIHTLSGASCTTSSGAANSTLCPDEETCSQNCVISPADYASSGVFTSGDSLTMYQYVKSDGGYTDASPRLYLLDPSGRDYEMLHLLGREISFTVDVSTLPCGENGALYLSSMDKTGGRNRYNSAGATYGSGYCDAQCPVETWRNGTLNVDGSGYCCDEMDILESNSQAAAMTPHPCSATDCDHDGCGMNAYAEGYHDYWAPGGTVDTSKPFTIVTQFITDDGTTSGTLTKINRRYIQDDKLVPTANSSGDAITESWCQAGDNAAATYGGLPTTGKALGEGMVLVFSIWNSASMGWLDGGSAGPCSSTAGNPSSIEANDPTTHVVFSNIRWGDIGSTTQVSTGSGRGNGSPSGPGVPTQTHWGQCGGNGYSGATRCTSPYTCQTQNPWYAQCL